MLDCLKANIAQATAMKAIDTDKAEAYGQYITAMEKFAGIRHQNLNKKISDASGSNMIIYIILAVVTVVGGVCGFKKFCSKDK